MTVELTNETVFSFGGPNLCLLGNEEDFKKLAQSLLQLIDANKPCTVELTKLAFVNIKSNIQSDIFFISKKGANSLGTFSQNHDLLFELDPRYWERIFIFFVLMSWDRRTYYLNNDDSSLEDLDLKQDCNFICSSEF